MDAFTPPAAYIALSNIIRISQNIDIIEENSTLTLFSNNVYLPSTIRLHVPCYNNKGSSSQEAHSQVEVIKQINALNRCIKRNYLWTPGETTKWEKVIIMIIKV